MKTPLIRGTTRADLLALPAIMLGFHPVASCVALALDGRTVRFCIRIDTPAVATDLHRIVAMIRRAAHNAGTSEFVLLGFGGDDETRRAIADLVAAFGEDSVVEALVTDGELYWSALRPEDAVRYRFDTSAVAAQAVYQGLNVLADRAAAIAPVRGVSRPAAAEVGRERRRLARLGTEAAMRRTGELAEAEYLSDADALQLAVLLEDEDRFTAFLTRLRTSTAEGYWGRLVRIRKGCPVESEPNILALLAIASWLSGRGAAQSSCMEQLTSCAPSHPVVSLLHQLHSDGIPPSAWDR